ncbi:hypothetical protein HR060_05960 [Catenovulum sp. SM1970]|uniref:carbohydrate binding domain-containing protein n=1 Tax=Marinifaba aquimaris TaxID=2741323 RepID=UPI00157189D6|nr:carbohydrate binding domain-containing protein [Marinifaba aquimaris]NTS76409.1 hypothetical protein [Marinifaba aquimaris]
MKNNLIKKGLFVCLALQLINPSFAANNNMSYKDLWHYATDPYGSSAKAQLPQTDTDIVSIEFDRVPRVDVKRNSWVELIYQLESGNLEGTNKVLINYKSSADLILKLSQKDYGKEGDQSYAHYQKVVPQANDWQTIEVDISKFSRPEWTPYHSSDVGIIKKNIDAIYFVPDLTDKTGGKASLSIKNIQLSE